ncbi:polyprotein [Gossypium australe]|uniref:Polyprotein n=1 Tax=Gossypium australe TaxID=47621 RepID=A0A5B6UQT1_9ROSI|nr:polyprotein [Gossypium australe]
MKSPYEQALYMKKNRVGDIMIVCLYVDDIVFTRNNSDMSRSETNRNEIIVSQKKYAKQILNKFRMKDCKPVANFK